MSNKQLALSSEQSASTAAETWQSGSSIATMSFSWCPCCGLGAFKKSNGRLLGVRGTKYVVGAEAIEAVAEKGGSFTACTMRGGLAEAISEQLKPKSVPVEV